MSLSPSWTRCLKRCPCRKWLRILLGEFVPARVCIYVYFCYVYNFVCVPLLLILLGEFVPARVCIYINFCYFYNFRMCAMVADPPRWVCACMCLYFMYIFTFFMCVFTTMYVRVFVHGSGPCCDYKKNCSGPCCDYKKNCRWKVLPASTALASTILKTMKYPEFWSFSISQFFLTIHTYIYACIHTYIYIICTAVWKASKVFQLYIETKAHTHIHTYIICTAVWKASKVFQLYIGTKEHTHIHTYIHTSYALQCEREARCFSCI